MAKYVPYMTVGGKLAVRRVVTNGAAQRAFKEQLVPKMEACAQKAKGVSNVSDRQDIFRECAKSVKGMKLSLDK